MKPILSVTINDEVRLEYDRSARLPGRQRDFIDMMESDMDAGIELDSGFIASPDRLQRGQYVAMNLVQGMAADNEALVGACCAYLSQRLADLREIRVEEEGDEFRLQLYFD